MTSGVGERAPVVHPRGPSEQPLTAGVRADGDLTAFDEAVRRVRAAAQRLEAEDVELREAAGRIAAETVRAGDDLVPYARSAMDGYAVRSSDVEAAARMPIDVPVRAFAYAERGETRHTPGTATAVATGAPLPYGADAVVPVELTEPSGDGVRILASVTAGAHVFPAADDARRGEVLVAAGERLRPASLALLASAGVRTLPVVRAPRIAVVCTGDELVEIGERPRRGEIRNSNAIMIAAMAQAEGARVVMQATVRDEPFALRATLERAVSSADLVITTGGASVGARDFVKATLAALGVSFAFRSVAARPAKPAAFGCAGRVLIAVLPGNPAAAFVGFTELVRPALSILSGKSVDADAPVRARLTQRINGKPAFHYLAFARVGFYGGQLTAEPLRNQCSSLVRGASDANALLVLSPRDGAYEAGEDVAVHILDWDRVGAPLAAQCI